MKLCRDLLRHSLEVQKPNSSSVYESCSMMSTFWLKPAAGHDADQPFALSWRIEAGARLGGKESIALTKPKLHFACAAVANWPVEDSQQEVADVGVSASLIERFDRQLKELLTHSGLAFDGER